MFNNTEEFWEGLLGWTTTEEFRHESNSPIFVISMVWVWKATPLSSVWILPPLGGAILAGSRTFRKKWVTKVRPSGFIAQDLLLPSLYLLMQTWVAASCPHSRSLESPLWLTSLSPWRPPLPNHEPEHTHPLLTGSVWCLISTAETVSYSAAQAAQALQASSLHCSLCPPVCRVWSARTRFWPHLSQQDIILEIAGCLNLKTTGYSNWQTVIKSNTRP